MRIMGFKLINNYLMWWNRNLRQKEKKKKRVVILSFKGILINSQDFYDKNIVYIRWVMYEINSCI